MGGREIGETNEGTSLTPAPSSSWERKRREEKELPLKVWVQKSINNAIIFSRWLSFNAGFCPFNGGFWTQSWEHFSFSGIVFLKNSRKEKPGETLQHRSYGEKKKKKDYVQISPNALLVIRPGMVIKKHTACFVPEILRFHYSPEKPSKKALEVDGACCLLSWKKHILSKQGERLEMICAALINLSEVVFRTHCINGTSFSFMPAAANFSVVSENDQWSRLAIFCTKQDDFPP